MLYVESDPRLPIELFLLIMEEEGDSRNMNDSQLCSLCIDYLHIPKNEKQTLLDISDWTELKSHLLSKFGCLTKPSSVNDKIQMLDSLQKKPSEKIEHFLIRVDYVVNFILSDFSCDCEKNLEITKLLFIAGLSLEGYQLSIIEQFKSANKIMQFLRSKEESVDTTEIRQEECGFSPVSDGEEVLWKPDQVKTEQSDSESDHKLVKSVRRPCKKLKLKGSSKCAKSFKLESDIHEATEHSKSGLCPMCKLEVPKKHLKQHIREQHNGMKYECDICGHQCPTQRNLGKHIKVCHQSDSGRKIQELISNSQVFVKHSSSEGKSSLIPIEPERVSGHKRSEIVVLKCALCLDVVKTRTGFVKHCNDHHNGFQFRCDMCDFRSKGKRQIWHHRFSMHDILSEGSIGYYCQIGECQFKTTCKPSLYKHYSETHEKVQLWTCGICSKSFSRKISYKKHIEQVHMGLKPCKCDQCGMSFRSNTELSNHIQKHHISAEEREVFVCEHCGSNFQMQRALRNHIRRVHHGEKTVECPHCPGKKFYNNALLKGHLRGVHQLDKRFACPTCNKGFATSYDVTHHVNVAHLNIKSFRCKLCKTFFTKGTNLARHVVVKHMGHDDYHSHLKQARHHEAFQNLNNREKVFESLAELDQTQTV